MTDEDRKRLRSAVPVRAGKLLSLLILAFVIVPFAGLAAYLRDRAHSNEKAVEYVAMGSSFAAGPGVGLRARGSLGLCEQSDVNYPHLLARQYGLSFNDVSCSGATTRDLLIGGQWFQPAQIDAVLPGTKLVTLTVGGNDVSYLASLTAWSCTNDPSKVPLLVRAVGLCHVQDQGGVEQAFQVLPSQLRQIVFEIRRRAPRAHILFVDYTTVLPDSGTCSRLPLTDSQADRGRELADRLRQITAQVARETDSELLPASDITHGHDLCSAHPWVKGFQFPSHFWAFGPAPFHPTEEAMKAISDATGRYLDPYFRSNKVSKDMDWSGGNFVQRRGTQLTLAGTPYRFGGMNIEWLGLEGYGPKGEVAPHVPTDFEVEDALSTAEEMGSRVVRSQTMGDTVGCPACLEPSPGIFNEEEFRHMDRVVASAARHHIRLIVTLTGDCAVCVRGNFPVNTGMNQYLSWFGDSEQAQFYSDPRIIAAFEAHIRAILDHRSAVTGIAYKDDPTILGWENCNLCSIESHIDPSSHLRPTLTSPEQQAAVAWVDEIGRYIKSIDSNHLYIDNSGFYRGAPETLDIPTVDVVGYEYYPHWAVATRLWVDRKLIDKDAELISQHGKVDVPVEIGWDRTNWFFKHNLQTLVSGIERNSSISGDGFWALQAHAPDHGWQTIPVDDRSWKAMLFGESGEWWAMYYTGKDTKINVGQDMAARAQILRTHFYAMAGVAVPAHHPSPRPAITSADNGSLAWQGSSGSATYDIERGETQYGPWQRICDRCVDDSQGTWTVPEPTSGWYRMTAYNLDGVPSPPSQPREMRARP